MARLKKLYRVCVWRKIAAESGRPAHWAKTNHRELDKDEARLLEGLAINLGMGFGPWCDQGREVLIGPDDMDSVRRRLITVERLS